MVRGDPVVSEHTHALGQFRIVCRDHTTFPCSDVLYRMEAEGAKIGHRSNRAAFISGSKGMAGICHQGDTMLLRDRAQLIVVSRVTSVVHSDDGFGTRCDLLLDFIRV